MAILISNDLSPHKIGIELYRGQLQAFPPCCMNDFMLKGTLGTRSAFICPCAEKFEKHVDAQYAHSSVAAVAHSNTWLAEWVEHWTGLSNVEVVVGVED